MLAPTRTPPVFPPPLPEPQPGRMSAEEMAARANLLKPMGAPQASMETHIQAKPETRADRTEAPVPAIDPATDRPVPREAGPTPIPAEATAAPGRGRQLDLLA
ncbi:MAG: hypothetical protein RMK64_10865 [Rhodovarius sp.]|nr:hypothetical protein [Rhodovarius sp.]